MMDQFQIAFDVVAGFFPKGLSWSIYEASCRNIAASLDRYAKPGARVLDFGAGNGFKTAVAAVLGYECSAYDDLQDAWAEGDEGRKFVEALAARFNLNYVVADSSLWPFANEYFDIVMMHDVLEHIHDSPKPIMNQLLNSTKVGGHVIVTVPNLVNIRKRLDVLRGRTNLEKFEAYYHHSGQWRGHVREYTRQDLELLAKLLGTVGRVAGCSPYAPESASRVLDLVQGPHDLDAGHGGHLDDGCTEAVRMESERRFVKGRAPSRAILSIGQRIKVTIYKKLLIERLILLEAN